MVKVETIHGNYTGYRFEMYSNRIMLFLLVGDDELERVVIMPFLFREVVRVTQV